MLSNENGNTRRKRKKDTEQTICLEHNMIIHTSLWAYVPSQGDLQSSWYMIMNRNLKAEQTSAHCAHKPRTFHVEHI